MPAERGPSGTGHERPWINKFEPPVAVPGPASERRCIQHGYYYSAICPICGKWWTPPASAAVSPAEPPEGDREAELHDAIELVRRALNQLTDHGSQRCMECLAHRKNGLDALERLDRGMRWMERRDA